MFFVSTSGVNGEQLIVLPFIVLSGIVNSKDTVILYQKTYRCSVLNSAEAGVHVDGNWKIWFGSCKAANS